MTACLGAGLTVTTSTRAAGPATTAKCSQARAPLVCETRLLRRKVWRMQDELGRRRYPSSFSERKVALRGYRLWVRDLWRSRLEAVARERRRMVAAIPHRAQLLRIARCETGGINGGRPLWTHHNSVYSGALGFLHATWNHYAPAGFARPASAASPLQQLYVGEILVRTFGGFSSWPACSVRLGLR